MRTKYIYDISLNHSWNEKCLRQNLYRKSKHTFLCSKTFLRKSGRLYDNLEKHCTARWVPDDNMAYALFMLDNQATYTHSEYVILIAFPGRQWLRESAWMLRLYVLRIILLLMPDGGQTPKAQ